MNTKSNIKTLLILALVVLLSSNSNIAQNVGIGSNSFTPDASAGLEIRYSDKGVLIPNVNIADLSTAAPVTSPAVSLLVYNTNETTGEGFYYWNGVAWISIGGTCITPIVPTEGTNIAKYYQITWNWIPSSDAPTFFKYNTVNDYNSAISTAGNNSLIMENLNCGQTYTIYVWAYNSCGNSTSLTLTQSTLECPIICGTSTVTFTYKGTPVTYGTAVGQNGTCWLDRNLGATQVATSSTDAASYGDLFQWGRLDDGHQNRTSSTFQWDSENDVPGTVVSLSPRQVELKTGAPQKTIIYGREETVLTTPVRPDGECLQKQSGQMKSRVGQVILPLHSHLRSNCRWEVAASFAAAQMLELSTVLAALVDIGAVQLMETMLDLSVSLAQTNIGEMRHVRRDTLSVVSKIRVS